jgi:hypothetical protein
MWRFLNCVCIITEDKLQLAKLQCGPGGQRSIKVTLSTADGVSRQAIGETCVLSRQLEASLVR